MTRSWSDAIDGFETISETEGLRVVLLTLSGEQCVPWHLHTEISDVFFCLEGRLRIERRDDDGGRLGAGDRYTVPPGAAHRVSALGGDRCRFLVVQGVGRYDFVPL